MPGGKQKHEKSGFSLEDAKASDGKRKAQKKENRILDIKPDDKTTFSILSKWFLGLEMNKSKAYYSTLTINLNSFNKVFGDMVVGQIRSADIEDYQMKRKAAGKSDSYVDQEVGAARSLINKAFVNGKISGDSLRAFKNVKKLLKRNSNARDRILSADEFNQLMNALPFHTRAIVATGYYTGMRKGEVLHLTWDKLDLKNRIISLEAPDTKDREPRTVPICDALYEILEKIPKAIHDKEVHKNRVFLFEGKPIRDIRTALVNACKKVGIPYGRGTKGGFIYHDTRHCFNTNMRKAGVPESVIMKITGHSTREMFLRYDSVDKDDKMQAVNKLDAYLAER